MAYRSNFEPGSTRWAVRRAQWLAMGLTEDDLLKPKIAVVNTSNQLSVCFQHLDSISLVVQEAIREAGGVPFEIHTAASSDFVTSAGKKGRYLMPTRDLMVNDIEVQVEGALLDGMILLSSCDKTTPAHLMAAGRLDLPAIIVPCGYQLGSGPCEGNAVDIEDVYNSVGAYKARQISLINLQDMTSRAIQGPGVCAGMATANTMHILSEALGMTLTGSAPIRAGSERLIENAIASGKRIVSMVEENLTARKILSAGAFKNAVRTAVVIGASVNCIRHLIAIACETCVEVDILTTLEEAGSLPQITQVRPNGPDRIETFDQAGGCRGVLKQLQSKLDLTVMTVDGQCLSHRCEEAPEPNRLSIRSLDDPFRKEPGLILIRGNLAPDGAIVKLSAVPPSARTFTGPCRVYEDEDEAIRDIGNGVIIAGDVVVLRMMGPLGGPGTVFAASFMAALVGAGFGSKVAVLTDGELSGLNSGLTIGQIMPEAAEGGPLAIVHDRDQVSINLKDRLIEIKISDDELVRRLKQWKWQPSLASGWLSQYRKLVSPMSKGAVLKTK